MDMLSLSYDLHIHSCLSPCGDDDMTPSNIVGMASLIGLLHTLFIKNINTLAVASLTECSCIILAEGTVFNEECMNTRIFSGFHDSRTVFA